MDLSQIGIGIGIGSAIVTFAGNWLFATKRDLSRSEAKAAEELAKHADAERTKNEAQFLRLFDKLDAVAQYVTDLRVEVAKIASENRYSRRRTSDPDPT